VASGASTARAGLDEAVRYPRPGDTLVVWKLDRLGRSLPHLIETIKLLDQRGVGFKSLHEHLDTTTPGGKLIFHLFGALAEFEPGARVRALIRERTQAGLVAARARGRTGGRPAVLDARRRQRAVALYREGKLTPAEIARTVGRSRSTLYRTIRAATLAR
jgi:DNA invertase Pin-like site-specific DNA recombinase